MQYQSPNPLDLHLTNQLDRVLDKQSEILTTARETRRVVDRIELRQTMNTSAPAEQKPKITWNPQLIIAIVVGGLAAGGHIGLEVAKAILGTLRL